MRAPIAQPSPLDLVRDGHKLTMIRHRLCVPFLPAPVRYALVPDPRAALEKPTIFFSLGGLTRAIFARRLGDDPGDPPPGLHFEDVAVAMRGRDGYVDGVSIWRTDEGTGADRSYLGWAYLNGQGRDVLMARMPADVATVGRAA